MNLNRQKNKIVMDTIHICDGLFVEMICLLYYSGAIQCDSLFYRILE